MTNQNTNSTSANQSGELTLTDSLQTQLDPVATELLSVASKSDHAGADARSYGYPQWPEVTVVEGGRQITARQALRFDRASDTTALHDYACDIQDVAQPADHFGVGITFGANNRATALRLSWDPSNSQVLTARTHAAQADRVLGTMNWVANSHNAVYSPERMGNARGFQKHPGTEVAAIELDLERQELRFSHQTTGEDTTQTYNAWSRDVASHGVKTLSAQSVYRYDAASKQFVLDEAASTQNTDMKVLTADKFDVHALVDQIVSLCPSDIQA